eukprot:CAMPEP_0172439516 /NCGR_PEP_ID=MMETSP1065-20121228/474_1 /TAXON_ID=265537 /ORGANISM="Amphiprora paludosa, Strain CCMP125" /LENGTH=969 /DNA_ID=CAMNT_0013188207 /DNA_START=79 /DNA_END=2988 /DNA_ORIENTATION=-
MASNGRSEEDPLLASNGNGAGDQTNGEEKTYFSPRTTFVDHFSLEAPSDEIQFRSHAVRVFSSGTQQFQVIEEEEKDDIEGSKSSGKTKLKARVSSDGSSGLSTLRAAYTLVAVLMMGFLLIFALQVLLFLFVSLVTEGGLTSQQNLNFAHLLGTVLSIPLFVYGLASALTMSTEFVADTWQGHSFFRSVLRISPTIIDWYSFLAFMGLPLGVMLYYMWTGDSTSSESVWWEMTALTWFWCITISYAIFCFVVFAVEIMGALELLSHHPDYALLEVGFRNVGKFLKRAILLRQLHSYSGVRNRTFYVEGSNTLPGNNDSYDALADTEFARETTSWYSKLMVKYAEADNGTGRQLFIEYDSPKRQYNIEDVLDRTVFVTDATWNLEKFYCRRSKARTVLVVNGPSRVYPRQMWSSLACATLGNVLVVLFVMALLRWGGASIPVVIVLTAIFVYVNRDAATRVYALYDTYQDTIKKNADNNAKNSEAIFEVTETYRLTKPTEKMCWILFVAEVFFLFVFPFWMLCDVGNQAIAFLFLILASFSAFRYYFNAPVVLAELGSLDLLDGDFIRTRSAAEQDEGAAAAATMEQDWREKNRLSKIVGHISQGARRDAWVSVIATFVMIFMFLFLSAFAGGSNSGAAQDTSNILKDFRYVPQNGTFQYPTCSMTSDFAIPSESGSGASSSALADYAYMAAIAYTAPESMPEVLDAWFGEDVAVDNVDLVSEFRSSREADSAVHFKLLTFPTLNSDFAVVTIRGTNNGWDMISDAQLWSAAWLAQAVRSVLPLGEIWNPILENLVETIGVLQSASLRKVAFYVSTSEFVEWLRDEKKLFPMLRVTGHSLGGGLAMITGAQTQTPAIGLSGPNTIITRKTLSPPVTLENLNKYTFNIIPDRDPVPMIDDPAKNVQHIACLAPSNNFIDCHTSIRSLCDIQYTCGSGPRPTMCDCALYYGYPEPESIGGRTFAEACPAPE